MPCVETYWWQKLGEITQPLSAEETAQLAQKDPIVERLQCADSVSKDA